MGSFLICMGNYMDTCNAVVGLVASSSVHLAAFLLSWYGPVLLHRRAIHPIPPVRTIHPGQDNITER